MKIAGLVLACCLLSSVIPGEAAESSELNLTELVKPLVLINTMHLEGIENITIIADHEGDLDFDASSRLRLNPKKKYIVIVVEDTEE